MREKDLDQLNTFFLGPQIESAQKEHIKELVLEKLAGERNASATSTEKKIKSIYKTVRNWGTKFRGSLKTLWWRWQWKLGIPLVVLVFLSFMGAQIFPHLTFQHFGRAPLDLSEISTEIGGEQRNFADYDSPTGKLPIMTDEDSANAAKTREAMALGTSGTSIPLPPDSLTPPADPILAKMITYNLKATIEVTNVAGTINKLNLDIQQLGGYVVDSHLGTRESGEYGHFSAKIPADKFDGFRVSMPNLGKILDQSQTANDITNQYYDAQTRLQNWEAEQLRYQEIIKQAKTVEEILKVEGSLANIRQQIEQLKGQLRFWNNAVQFSTVQIELKPASNLILKVDDPWQPVSWLKTWKAAQAAMLKTISNSWNVLNYGIVGLGYVLPYVILFGTIYLGYCYLKKRKN